MDSNPSKFSTSLTGSWIDKNELPKHNYETRRW